MSIGCFQQYIRSTPTMSTISLEVDYFNATKPCKTPNSERPNSCRATSEKPPTMSIILSSLDYLTFSELQEINLEHTSLLVLYTSVQEIPLMASLPFLHSPSSLLVLLSAYALLLTCNASPVEFRVGGVLGWRKPTGNESETYNHWARRNRFHIGDSLYFKYENDAVLVVDREDYARCNTTSPLLRYTDGNTTFRFDRYGYFYFISGELSHCRAAQKLIVRVMVHSEMVSPAPAPAPGPFAGHDTGSGSTSWPGNPGQPGSSGSSRAEPVAIAVAGLVAGLMLA